LVDVDLVLLGQLRQSLIALNAAKASLALNAAEWFLLVLFISVLRLQPLEGKAIPVIRTEASLKRLSDFVGPALLADLALMK
jgi:hypothetical protein